MRHQILANGNLEIRIDEREQARLKMCREENPDGWDSNRAMYDELEPLTANSDLDWVRPEWIGALTDAPILGTFGETREVTEADGDYYRLAGQWENAAGELVRWLDPIEAVWWFEPYAVRSPQDDLADTGRCVFKKAQQESEDA